MLGSFKIRMLMVIVIAVLVGLALQSDNRSQEVVSPIIKYVMRDYGVEEKLALYLENMLGQSSGQGVQASGDVTMQPPCSINSIKQHYGWYWNGKDQKQEFNSGIVLQVEGNTLVKPTMAGRIDSISSDKDGRSVKIVHSDGLISVYGRLQEVLVKKGAAVSSDQVLGKTGKSLYFELQNEDGPINPESLFKDADKAK